MTYKYYNYHWPPQIMQEAFQCSLPVLRALFEASGSDVNQFIMSSEQ